MTVLGGNGPEPRVINRIITRGMGAPRGTGRASLVVHGGGGFRRLIEFVKRKAGDGAKFIKDNIDEVIVWAKMIRINEEKPKVLIQGIDRAQFVKNKKVSVKAIQFLKNRARAAWEDIKISIRRVK